MRDELKPCPFCGMQPRISDLPESAIHVACKCGVSMFGGKNHHSSHKEASDRWNSRAPQWQPIETAPKDGRPVLVTASHITGPNGEPVVWAAVFVQKLGRWVSTWDGEPLNDATHWQPLPAPPEVK